ncbi:hypothetical protein CRM22_005626 [Opisthorchis felineus]|uniref:Phosphatidylinositol-specific phospholipase C X domain-containing protein n=3 Tax=Opisthorchis felineus TaxID=147828 RepID=A0A4S2LQA6_OPIFE|nr:hypothetical protein CRM22_005626 [Opisthorchis felineus]
MTEGSLPLQSQSLSEWMTNLPGEVTLQPINRLAIPGSHDSFTSAITNDSIPSPDCDVYSLVRNLPQNIAGPMLRPWTTTQGLNTIDQLRAGIRYLDLRVAVRSVRNEDDVFYIVHGQYICPMVNALREVAEFLREHPQEILLLDCNHCYEFDTDKHLTAFEAAILDVLGQYLYPVQDTVPTLEDLWKSGKQVLCFSCLHSIGSGKFWPGRRMVSLWPNTVHVEEMLQFLDEHYGPRFVRNPNNFYVYQGVLTPTPDYILRNLTGSLRQLAKRAGAEFTRWIQAPDRLAGLHGLNITLMDYVVTEFPDYAQNVIYLNYKTWAKNSAMPNFSRISIDNCDMA